MSGLRITGLDHLVLTVASIDEVVAVLAQHDVPIVEGPVTRTGARGPIRSIYVRDPDADLVEIANY